MSVSVILADTATPYSVTSSSGSLDGWTGTVGSAYADGSVKFGTQGNNLSNTSIWSSDVSTYMTSISVTIKYKINGTGSSSNVFTVAAVNSSGVVKASATFAPTSTSYTDAIVYLTIPSNSAVTGLKITYTTKSSGNVGLKSLSATASYTPQIQTLYTIHFKDSLNEHYFDSTDISSCILPNVEPTSICQSFGWEFAGWSDSKTDFSNLKTSPYVPTQETTLYAVYINGSESNLYTLDYSVETDLSSSTSWGSYGTAYSYTATDGSEWVVKAYKSSGMQINTGKNSSIKIPDCPANITSIEISCTVAKAVGLSLSDYSGSGTITYEVYGTDATKQTLDFTGKSIIGGYIVSKSGSTSITKIVVNYGSGSGEYSLNPTCTTISVDTVTLPVDTIRIHIGETYELTPTVLPSNATNKNVSWMSTMSSIATVENGVVTGVAEGTAAAIVVTEDGNKYAACVVIVLENANIDVVEWNPDWLKIDVENFTAATATLEDQNTQVEVKKNFADSLFFSKYFEAASNVKLLGVYNGTNHIIDISSYGISIATCSDKTPSSSSFSTTLFSEFVYRDVNNYDNTLHLTDEEMLLSPNEEIIFISYQKGNASDSAIIKCAKENSKSGFDRYYRLKTPELQFSGNDAIALVNPDNNFIDLIGAGTKAGGSNISNVDRTTTTTGTYNGFMDNPGGWYSADGINIETNDSSYALSTNRCLLIRKNRVKSGLNAVARNTTDFVTLGGVYGEWRGLQIPGSTDGGTGDGVSNACSGFDDIGSFDYNDYYIGYDTIYEETPFDGQEDDGYYKIEIPNLDALSCTNLKITVKDESSNELEKIVKIPIMIKTPAYTDDDTYFDKKDCDKCDVVVLKDMTLTSRGDRTNRDVKLYEGAELVVDNSSTYTINSLAFRRYNDSVSSLFMNGGTLNVTDKVYFDLHITPDDWHYISLPTSYTISNVKYVNGKTPAYGEDYLVRHYDGKYRAENLKGGWKNTPLDSTFNAGNGFIFGLSDEHKKKEFRFEFNNSVITAESSNKTVNELHSWGGNKSDEELRPNHKGWNLIGNPFLGHLNAEIYDKIRIDSLVKVIENGKWTGQWELSNTDRGKSLRYAVIPSDAPEDRDAGGYKSVVLDDMKLLPFTCFFVQIGGNDESAKGIEFKTSRRSNRIVTRNYQEDEDDELFLRVKVDNWKTGCFISNKFSDKYEPGDDLESHYQIYQSIGGYKLLYSAINDSIIEHGVQVTAPQGTLYLDSKVDVNKFEYIYVNYNDSWFDLMRGETVDIESSNFILQAKRKNNNIATGLDAIPTNGVYKFSDGNNIYINRNNTIFNILGSKVK